MRQDITLSTGRVVSHKPYMVAGEPNGAIEAFILTHYVIGGIKIEKHSELTNQEWAEYCSILNKESAQ